MKDTPLDPISPAAAQAISWHQIMTEYEAAGFTHDEAFQLIEGQSLQYWAAVYEEMTARGKDETR